MAKKRTIGVLGGAAMLCLGLGFSTFTLVNAEENFVIPEMVTGTATVTVTGEVSIPSFQMKEGASVRVKAPNGIRFETGISLEDLNKLPSNATFGTLIIPTALLNGETLNLATVDALNVEATVWRKTSTASSLTYSGVLVGTDEADFPEMFYGEEITARGYVSYTDSNDQNHVIYTADTAERSMAYVAGAALKGNVGTQEGDDAYLAPESVTFLTGIVDTVVEEIGITVDGAVASNVEMETSESVTFSVTGNQGIPAIITTTGGIQVNGNTITAVAAGEATLTATVGNRTATVTFTVYPAAVYNITTEMLEGVWGGWTSTRDDGKLVYAANEWACGIALTDSAFANIKQMAETYGYSKLVATIYSVDSNNLCNIFREGKYNDAMGNVQGTFNMFTEQDEPVRREVAYDTFKDWESFQIFYSNWAATNVVFTLTFEKYEVAAVNQTKGVDTTFGFNELSVVVKNGGDAVANLSYADFEVTSLNPDVVTYDNGVFTTKASGNAVICVAYKGCVAYVEVTVMGASYAITANMLENVGGGWTGSAAATEDGKLLYSASNWAGGISLTDSAFANIKQMAETYGYTNLVATIYSVDSNNLCNIFREGKTNSDMGNVQGTFNMFTEQDRPVRCEVAYDTFKNWESIQIFYSNWAATNVVFTLTLEKYSVAAEDEMTVAGATFNLTDVKVAVTEAAGVVANWTAADFNVTSLNTNVVTYENGVFTAKGEGLAVVRMEYKGCATYITVSVLNETKVNLANLMSLAGLTVWYAPNATLTDLGNGRLKIDNPTENNNCGWRLTGDQLALVRKVAAEFGFNKLTIEVYANPNGVLAAQGGSVAGTFPDKGFFWQVGGSVITTQATDENPIKGSPRDDIFAENMLGYWNEIVVGVHGIGSIEFSLFLEKV